MSQAGGSEHDHQRALVEWAHLMVATRQLPDLDDLYAVPNGGFRSKRTAGRMAAEGMRAGVSDLVLPVPRRDYHGLYLELKAPIVAKRGIKALSAAQREWLERRARCGYCACVAFSADAAISALRWYLGDARWDVKYWRTIPQTGLHLWIDPS